eukprot:CAMPEP_0119354204 /NCGR_PEP_ID=MMETSP1334-20130426/3228_1 /TAXON_ID=127549 /ORGANISM="Calcidiscus leptoporus, Strain RCC1130" /LENGTH=65 /DNA_ID=CAMNT_0007367691 /DNA_START=836 /DNA_END=1033 /DNA_ORIENTATION=+
MASLATIVVLESALHVASLPLRTRALRAPPPARGSAHYALGLYRASEQTDRPCEQSMSTAVGDCE